MSLPIAPLEGLSGSGSVLGSLADLAPVDGLALLVAGTRLARGGLQIRRRRIGGLPALLPRHLLADGGHDVVALVAALLPTLHLRLSPATLGGVVIHRGALLTGDLERGGVS